MLETVEVTPDGTKLIIGGTFKTVGGKTLSKLAVISPTTGAPLSTFNFAGNTNNPVTAAAATNTTIYVGGRFSVLNGTSHTGLAAVNATTGAVDPNFNLNLSGGIGVNGELTVQALKLTHDETKLVVVHTGRQINGQDRLGVAEIDTASKTLLPWRTRLWDDNLARLGGVTRIYAGDISPDDSYMVVSEGSGGDAPPISDTAIRFPIAGADNVQPDWVSRHFDSVYSVAITEDAVYLGGHFQFEPSPTAPSPWPGLTTSATAPARACPATGWATTSSDATTSRPSTRPPGTPSSGTRARTPSRATRPCSRHPAACSPVVTPASRAARASGASRSTTSTTTPARRPRSTPRSPRPSRVEWWPAARPSRSPAPPPRRWGSSGSRSRSRTATPSAGWQPTG